MEKKAFDVLVIGAGAAGLLAALEVAIAGRSVAIIEANDRVGGRIFTKHKDGLAVELGAEFVHGNLALTKELLTKAGIKTIAVKGSTWQHQKKSWQQQEDFIEDGDELKKKLSGLQTDKTVADFLRDDLSQYNHSKLRSSLKNYVEGYYAADTNKASTTALAAELSKEEDEQYRVEGGYQRLIDYLENQCRKNAVVFFLSQSVVQVQWKKGTVLALTGKNSFAGIKLVVTVPVGVLQNESITFHPALPQLQKTVCQLGFGKVVKVVVELKAPFWHNKALTGGEDLSEAGFLFSGEEIPTWWTHHPQNDKVLTGWLGGPKADPFGLLSREEVEARVMLSLSRLFNLDVTQVQQKIAEIWYQNWSANPAFCGAYSYEVVGGAKLIETMQQTVEETIFFAGEGWHTGPQIGTVEGALQSGKETARRLVASFSF